ncbi:MAG: GTP 3',8-cyclase MoaA [Candidatus Hadarchaeales archaeon]
MLKDRYGREIRGLRISITSRCNLRCFYCHGEGCRAGSTEMTPPEIEKIARLAFELGIRSVKITGGEPLVRDDICDIVKGISSAGFEDISMTTNGLFLAEKAADLCEAGLRRVNVSLDTLRPELYARITGESALPRVLSGIEAALKAGMNPVKINTVVLSGLNEDEIPDMIGYASRHGVALQLIELVDAGGEIFMKHHADLSDIEDMVRKRAIKLVTRDDMQARRRYLLPGVEVEIVRPVHSSEFCARCTRLRLTPDGFLKPCLMRDDGTVDLVSHIRSGDMDGARRAFLRAVEAREPFWKEKT